MASHAAQSFYRTEGSPAPGELIRVQGFLNTWSQELGIEDFESPQAMESWLRKASLWDADKSVSVREHQRIADFRLQLRAFVRDPAQGQPLAALTEKLSFSMCLDDAGVLSMAPAGRGSDLVLGRLLSIVYNSMTDGTWARFKCCGLESCGWAFYDTTRSRTRRWCSMRTCGSRHKAREYYRRQR